MTPLIQTDILNRVFFLIGAYFSPNASYSHKFTEKKNMHIHYGRKKKMMLNGQKVKVRKFRTTLKHTMLLSRVLIGFYTRGYKDDALPPLQAGPDGFQPFDSTVDREDNPNAYCIFNNQQIYPEYIIRYESERTD